MQTLRFWSKAEGTTIYAIAPDQPLALVETEGLTQDLS